MTNRIKACARCGSEFTYQRSTAKYCSDSCRRYSNLTAQRKRQKRNADRRIMRDIQRRWKNLEDRRERYSDERQELMYDAQGGCSFSADRLERLEQDIERVRHYWDRDERMLRKDAEKNGIAWSKIVQNKSAR